MENECDNCGSIEVDEDPINRKSTCRSCESEFEWPNKEDSQ